MPPSQPLVDALISDLDARLAAALDAVLHHPAVRRVEALWRGLHLLVTRLRPQDNLRVELLPLTRDELAADLTGAADLAHTGLWQHVHARAYGSFGGRPYGLLCAAFAFGPGPDDLALLRRAAALAARVHAPFLADAAPALLGVAAHAEVPQLRDLAAAQSGPRFTDWHALRGEPDARYLALCLPRFLLRAPHDLAADPTRPLRYRETVDGPADLLWGPACLLLALRAAEAFAAQRWCVGLVGTRTGPELLRVGDARCTLEVLLAPRSERMLADAGLVPLTADRASARAIVREAPTLQRPPADDPLAAQLPYVLLVGRLAHYLQRIQREQIGQWDDRAALQRVLEHWLRRLVADMDDPPPEVRAHKPLRSAAVALTPGDAGWYRCHLRVVPHLTHLGRPLALELIGRFDLRPPA
jgi:type VI secretion system protein ImpC